MRPNPRPDALQCDATGVCLAFYSAIVYQAANQSEGGFMNQKSVSAFLTAASVLAALIAFGTFTSPAVAGELDGVTQGSAPQGLIVRVDASGNREVFKAGGAVANDADAAQAVATFVKNENLIAHVASASELDRSSSSEAWFFWPGSSYYGYSYWYANYSYNYWPCYRWNYGYYNYSYYRWY
jgi:hypothetical protein